MKEKMEKSIPGWMEKFLSGKKSYFVISLTAFLVYFPVLFFGFTYLDDNSLIIDHAGFLGQFLNIFESFRQDVFLSYLDAYYRPIMTVSLIFDAQFFGSNPFMFHFTNIIIHILSTISLFIIFQKMNYRKDISFVFSIIFLVHPVLTQAVAWVPGRNDSLLALFVLVNFIYLLKFLEKKDGRTLFFYFLFFALSIFTKESAIFIPFVQLFYLQFIYKERFFSQNKKKLIAGWILIIGVFFVLRHNALTNPIDMPFSNMFKSVFINSPAVIQFLGKIFFPFNLSVVPIIQDTTFIFGIFSIVLLFVLIFFSRKIRWNYFLFGSAWFFVFLLPSFIRPNIEIVADFIEHRVYLPLIGFMILIMEIEIFKKIDLKKRSNAFILFLVISLFSFLTVVHSQNFKDKITFWKNAAENSPNYPLAHRNYGAMLFLDNKYDEAETEYKKSLELNPKEQMAHNNLGLIYVQRGELEKAEKEYEKELENNPYYDSAYFNKGILYYKTGRIEEAIAAWKRTLEINPNYPDPVYNLFSIYYQRQDKENSIYWAKEAQRRGMQLMPEMEKTINPFGSILNK